MHASNHRWDSRGTAVVALIVAVPLLAMLLLMSRSGDARDHVQTSAFISYALVLGASVFVYFHWRIATLRGADPMDIRLAGWLTVGLVGGSLQGLVQAVNLQPITREEPDSWPLVMQLVLLSVLGLIALVAERIDPPADPALTGAIGGLLLTALFVVTMMVAPPLTPTPMVAHLLNAMVLVGGLVLAVIVLLRRHVSRWVRRRLALAAIVLFGAHCGVNLTGDHPVFMTLVMAANLVGSIVLCTMVQSLLRGSLLHYHDEMQRLGESLREMRAGSLEDRELLHEVGSTLAGITSASRMIQHGPEVSTLRRERLQEMLTAELGRLERLMCARAPSNSIHFEIDAVVEPLVLSHQTRGRDVRWQPSQTLAHGDPDDVAEVVNILLENAARHGGVGPIRVHAWADGDFVEIVCSDSGPGVNPSVRPHLFTSGIRGPASQGQGLGLAIAQRLMSNAGGTLELLESVLPGATFVARLPNSEPAHVAAQIA
jgi:signal transduction histidine kinase